MKGYHIAPKKARNKILTEGLKPNLGPRSSEFGETEKKLFFTVDLSESVKLANFRKFNEHPDFSKGIDIWKIEIPENIVVEKDHKSSNGYFTKEIIGVLDMDLVKSFEWMEETA